MCEEKPEILEVEILEASHPRVAGIVQTHRQQVDTQTGRQQGRTKDIKLARYQPVGGRVKFGGSLSAHGPHNQFAWMGVSVHSAGLSGGDHDDLAPRPQRSAERAKKTVCKDADNAFCRRRPFGAGHRAKRGSAEGVSKRPSAPFCDLFFLCGRSVRDRC